MGARKEDIEEANRPENKNMTGGINMDNRKCTDVIMCIVFVVFIGLLGYITNFSLAEGDPIKIITPFDSQGNKCGFNNLTSGVDMTEYRFKFLPNIMDKISLATDAKYEAVCVKECPKSGEALLCPDAGILGCPTADYDSVKKLTYCLPTLSESTETVQDLYNMLD